MRFRVILAVATFALAGCNANQDVNLSSKVAPGVGCGPNLPDYNPYNPVTYAQTSGLYGGGQNYHGAGC